VFAELSDTKAHSFHSAATVDGDGTDFVNADKYTSMAVTVAITNTATVTFKVSQNGADFAEKLCTPSDSTTAVTSVDSTKQLQCNIAGYAAVRMSISSCASCTVTVTGTVTTALFGSGSGGGSGATPTLDQVIAQGAETDNATSLANAVKIGGTLKWCIYEDATTGLQLRPCVDANVRQLIPTNFVGGFYDEEGDKYFLTVDPDAIGVGSGTATMNTSEQFVASNFGVEFAESDTNPACSSGNYNIYADTSETRLKSCHNGTTFDVPRIGFVRKTGDETVDSQTRQNDDHLTFTLDASSVYTLEMFIIYASTTTADFQHEFATPADAVGHFRYDRYPSSATTCNTATTTAGNLILSSGSAVDNSQGGAGASTRCMLTVHGQITTTTGGTFNYKWAQTNDDGVTVATVFTNSYILYRKH
jgi:hypothetical protein